MEAGCAVGRQTKLQVSKQPFESVKNEWGGLGLWTCWFPQTVRMAVSFLILLVEP